MSFETEKPVSFRAFARMVGKTDGGVRKAIASGTIVEGIFVNDKGEQKIIPSIASKEWGYDLLDQVANDLLEGVGVIPAGDPEPEPTAPEKKEGDEDASDSEDIAEADILKDIPDGLSKAQAERRIKVIEAKKKQLELLQLMGEVVDKGLVYQILFEFAVTLKENILNVPDRCIDNIRAAETRNEALIILGNEITSSLRSLANIADIHFVKDR